MEDWDPRDPAVLRDQRQAYDKMRETCPVAHSDYLGWSLFRHQDIAAVLDKPGDYSNASRFPAIPNGMDPPEHGRYREALAVHFTPRNIKRLEPRARAIAAELLQSLLDDGEGEFIEDFATPLAFRVLCALLGWRQDLWECLAGWAHDNQEAAFTRDSAAGKALHKLFSEHVKANLEAQRADPGEQDNATATLLNTQVGDSSLDDDQIVTVLRNWAAGHGTLAAGLGIVLAHLAQDQALQDRLRNDPSLIPAAVEEILRIDGPLVANKRGTTRQVEIQGRSIPEGAGLSLMWIAANRDPRVFEEPDKVRLDRDQGNNLLWGRGIHLCQGAPLARMELRVALEELLSRSANFTLAGEQPKRGHLPGNGLVKLPMRCRKAAGGAGPAHEQ